MALKRHSNSEVFWSRLCCYSKKISFGTTFIFPATAFVVLFMLNALEKLVKELTEKQLKIMLGWIESYDKNILIVLFN